MKKIILILLVFMSFAIFAQTSVKTDTIKCRGGASFGNNVSLNSNQLKDVGTAIDTTDAMPWWQIEDSLPGLVLKNDSIKYDDFAVLAVVSQVNDNTFFINSSYGDKTNRIQVGDSLTVKTYSYQLSETNIPIIWYEPGIEGKVLDGIDHSSSLTRYARLIFHGGTGTADTSILGRYDYYIEEGDTTNYFSCDDEVPVAADNTLMDAEPRVYNELECAISDIYWNGTNTVITLDHNIYGEEPIFENVKTSYFNVKNWTLANTDLSKKVGQGKYGIDLSFNTPIKEMDADSNVVYVKNIKKINSDSSLTVISTGLFENGQGLRVNKYSMSDNYGTSGYNSVDLSMSTNSSTTHGATGNSSFAAGNNSTASGSFSIAIGNDNEASGYNSASLGVRNIASGYESMSIGTSNTSSGRKAKSFGQSNTASADCSVCIGHTNTSSGSYSVCLGTGNTSSGMYSSALNSDCVAAGNFSFSGGYRSTSEGVNSFSFQNCFSGNTASAKADFSAILGGRNNTIETTATNSAIIAGDNITATIPNALYSQHAILSKSITIGNTNTTARDGEIRFDGTNFKGYNGTEWKNFDETGGSISIWEVVGNETQLITANDIDIQTKEVINAADPTTAQGLVTRNYLHNQGLELTGDIVASWDVQDIGTTTIQSDAVEYNMLNDNVISGQTEIASGFDSNDEILVSSKGTVGKMKFSTLEDLIPPVNVTPNFSTGLVLNDGTNTGLSASNKLFFTSNILQNYGVGTNYPAFSTVGFSSTGTVDVSPCIALGKSMSSSYGTVTTVEDGDYLGRIIFSGAKSSSGAGEVWGKGARIAAVADATFWNGTTENYGTELKLQTVVKGSTTLIDRILIDGNGKTNINNVLRLIPQSSAPSSATEGDIYVNSSSHHIYCYLNGSWVQLDN